MSSMSKKLMLVIIPIIVLIICCLVTLLFVSGNTGTELCLQQIQTAQKYVAAGDYEKAIVYYQKAIEADKTQETPYLNLADLYYNLNDIDSAISILRTGFDNAGTDKIKNALQRYLDLKAADGTDTIENKSSNDAGDFNNQLINIFSTYNYQQYGQTYTIEKEQFLNGVYTVKYLNIDASFIYSDGDTKLIDETKYKPYDYAKPKEIIINDLDIIITGASSGVSVEDIEKAVSINIKIKHDNKLNIDYIAFKYMDCDYQLECDENGNIIAESQNNKIFPEPAAEQETTETRTIATANIDVVFTVDVSGSMSGDIDTAKSALNSFIDALDDKDRAGLVEFNETSRILCGLTTDKNSVRSQVSNLTATGTTAMYTGLSNALDLLTNSSETYGYKMIVILSDGYDSRPNVDVYSNLINTAVNNDVVVYTVGIGSSVDTSLLTQLASQTGGEYYQAADASQIVNIFDEIQNEQVVVNNTSSDYLLNYSAGLNDGKHNGFNSSAALFNNTKTDAAKGKIDSGKSVQQFALLNDKIFNYFSVKSRQLISISGNVT